jgi:hypothetical protein
MSGVAKPAACEMAAGENGLCGVMKMKMSKQPMISKIES